MIIFDLDVIIVSTDRRFFITILDFQLTILWPVENNLTSSHSYPLSHRARRDTCPAPSRRRPPSACPARWCGATACWPWTLKDTSSKHPSIKREHLIDSHLPSAFSTMTTAQSGMASPVAAPHDLRTPDSQDRMESRPWDLYASRSCNFIEGIDLA